MEWTAEEYQALGFTPFDTAQQGPLRERALPYEAVGDYDGIPTPIRFGAFLGWDQYELEAIAKLPIWERRRLLDIDHQVGGHACLGRYFYAIPVALKRDIVPFWAELCADYYHAEHGWLEMGHPETLRFVAEYREKLTRCGLTAEQHYCDRDDGLNESLYLVDTTASNLQIMLAQPLEGKALLASFLGEERLRNRLRLFVLADNSD